MSDKVNRFFSTSAIVIHNNNFTIKSRNMPWSHYLFYFESASSLSKFIQMV